MSRTRAVITATLLSATLVLAGCGGDDPQPKFAPSSPSTTHAPATSGSSDASEPPMPDAVMRHDKAGSSAFVTYFVTVLNYAQRTGDTERLSELFSESCRACSGYVDGIRSAYDGGGHITGGELSIGAIRDLPPDYGADLGAFAEGRSKPQVIMDGDGRRKSFDGGAFKLFAYMKWTGGGWRMHWIRTPS